jgi:hypothetical protein
MDCLIIAGIALILWDRQRGKGDLENRIDDITEGLAAFMQHTAKTSEELLKIKDFMPEISLVNQNPIASLVELFQTLTGNNGFNNPPQGEDGRFIEPEMLQDATTTQDTTDTTTL